MLKSGRDTSVHLQFGAKSPGENISPVLDVTPENLNRTLVTPGLSENIQGKVCQFDSVDSELGENVSHIYTGENVLLVSHTR